MIRVFRKAEGHTRRMVALIGLGTLLVTMGCQGMPPLGEQERLVRDLQLTPLKVSPMAVVNVWGKPVYHHSEFTQFFVMPDMTMVPRSRVAIGEVPAGWDAAVDAGDGVFLGYPEQGWLLVFFDDRLVYREELKADEVHKLGKAWQYEDRFRTRLEGASPR